VQKNPIKEIIFCRIGYKNVLAHLKSHVTAKPCTATGRAHVHITAFPPFFFFGGMCQQALLCRARVSEYGALLREHGALLSVYEAIVSLEACANRPCSAAKCGACGIRLLRGNVTHGC